MPAKWWSMRNFKFHLFLMMTGAICLTALTVELILEPLIEGDMFSHDSEIDWYEVPPWLIGSLVVGMLISFVITKLIMRRLDRLSRAAEEIAMGNLSARVAGETDSGYIFGRINRRFNQMAETIECLLNNERRLLSDISHELRSPLARVSAAVELMEMRDKSGRFSRSLGQIGREISHMDHLVGVLLEQNNNRLAIREGRTRVDVSALASELAESFRMQGATQRVTVNVDVTPGVHVDGHPMQLRLIVENIMNNALFYAPPDTSVDLRLGAVRDNAIIEVRDYGPGVPADKLEDIFKAFYRVDSARARKSGGIGLGLTLVHEACLALGGTVEATNRHPGLGVLVALPLSRTKTTDQVPERRT